MTEEEEVAYAMQMSMAEAGRGGALAEENKKEGEGPLEAHKEGNNVPRPQAASEEDEKEGDGPIEAHKGSEPQGRPGRGI